MTQSKFVFNQQVKADITYEARVKKAHKALSESDLFRSLDMEVSKVVLRRPWFGFDRDKQFEDLNQPIVIDPKKISRIIDDFKNNRPLHSLSDFNGALFDADTISGVLKSYKSAGRFKITFDPEMTQDDVMEKIEEALPFIRLAQTVARLSRHLKHKDRGALLSIEGSYTPAFF